VEVVELAAVEEVVVVDVVVEAVEAVAVVGEVVVVVVAAAGAAKPSFPGLSITISVLSSFNVLCNCYLQISLVSNKSSSKMLDRSF
jgi:hypothetical protein